MIAKVDHSKSAVCGPNQLILVRAPYIYEENHFGTNFFSILVSQCRQKSCFLLATADKNAEKIDAKMIFT